MLYSSPCYLRAICGEFFSLERDFCQWSHSSENRYNVKSN